MVVHSDYLDGASGLAHLPWCDWQWCVTESREILKEKKKKLTFVALFYWKKRIRKEMAGGEGAGRE